MPLKRLLVIGSCGLSAAAPLVPDTARCLRVADHDFNRLFADQVDGSGNLGRRSTEADCDHACNNADSEHSSWCIGFEFRDTEKGMCELYDDCSTKSPAPSPVAKEAQAAPAKVERCLRVSDHNFDALFADQLDGSGNPGRKSTKADCDHACNNADSEHSAWCIGFEFRETEKGMCELYEDCSKKAATADSPAAPSATEHTTPFAAQAAQNVPTQEKPAEEKPAEEKPAEEKPAEQASSGLRRCLRVSDHDFDSSFSKQLDASGNVGRRATKEDCDKLCNDPESEKHNWCVGFEFRDTEKGTCELYDMCTPEVEKERKEAAANEATAKAAAAEKLQVAPAAARCLRVSDDDFDRWFVEHYDKTGHKPGRKSTAEDCEHVCSDASSEHHSWCVGFEFKPTEKGTCELYEGCTEEQAQQSQQARQQQQS